MSREIKFRCVYKSELLPEVRFVYANLDEIADPDMKSGPFAVVNDWIVHDGYQWLETDEYTGLKDKNGKEIYEGDIIILKINDYGNWIWGKYAVYYDQGKVGFRLKNGDEEWSFTSANDIEVIGNIYESEVNTHENNSNSPHHSTTQSKAEETADEGGLQA